MTSLRDLPTKVRIAPSPTGDPHVGTAYIALFNYAFAKQRGGKFILRIEDTDRARSTKFSEDTILSSLRWLGLEWDEGPDVGGPCGPYRQSERLEIYRQHAQMLLDSGAAYWCSCTAERLDGVRKQQMANKQNPGYDGHCRHRNPEEVKAEIAAGAPGVVRLKVPRENDPSFADRIETTIHDLLRGDITFQHTEIDDQVLLKNDGFPTYHLANVVDDHLMEITNVIRGEEWITSTPKHKLLYDAFGWEMPQMAHLPLLRNSDKSKVSKRKNPVSISYYRQSGYFPDAVINFLGTMAFTFEDGREIFTLQDFVENFKLERVVLGGPVFDLKKLLWINGRYWREQRNDEQIVSYLTERLFSKEYLLQIAPLIRERVEKSEDLAEYGSFFFTGTVPVNPADLLLKNKEKQAVGKKDLVAFYESMVEMIDTLYDFNPQKIEESLRAYGDKNGEKLGITAKDIFMPVRIMVTGKKATPPLFETMSVLGRERVRTRIRAAIDVLKKYEIPAAPAPKA